VTRPIARDIPGDLISQLRPGVPSLRLLPYAPGPRLP